MVPGMTHSRPTCALCGQPLPKEKPATPKDDTADRVREVREATERSIAEGRTAAEDMNEGGAVAAQRRRQG